jgi:aminoglycoside 3-N-acetyltransferase
MAKETVLQTILEEGRVPRDALLVVHSAFAGLSRQDFQAEATIEVLLNYLADGGLYMPTMTWRTVTPERPEWDELNTPSHTGTLTEIFRTRYAIARSIHPTHSVAGAGLAADILLSRHHIDDTPVSENSPYGLMRDYDAYILMLGVGLECCTAIHLPEETIAEESYVLPADTVVTYRCTDRRGVTHRVRARRHRKLDRDFPRFAEPLQRARMLRRGHIGSCPWTLVSLPDLLRYVMAALIRDPHATLRRG